MRGAERGVAGERQLALRGEDPHPVVGAVVGGSEQERRLGEVRPVREPPHLVVGEVVGAVDNRDRVTEERLLSEHVNLPELPVHSTILTITSRKGSRSADPAAWSGRA